MEVILQNRFQASGVAVRYAFGQRSGVKAICFQNLHRDVLPYQTIQEMVFGGRFFQFSEARFPSLCASGLNAGVRSATPASSLLRQVGGP